MPTVSLIGRATSQSRNLLGWETRLAAANVALSCHVMRFWSSWSSSGNALLSCQTSSKNGKKQKNYWLPLNGVDMVRLAWHVAFNGSTLLARENHPSNCTSSYGNESTKFVGIWTIPSPCHVQFFPSLLRHNVINYNNSQTKSYFLCCDVIFHLTIFSVICLWCVLFTFHQNSGNNHSTAYHA